MNAVINQTFNAPASNVFDAERAASQGELSGGITGGYAIMRIRGKVWTIHHAQQDHPLMRDDGDGPRNSIDVVILKANPLMSKTWYENGFEEGSNNPPDCASANGIVPDQGVPKKQSNQCAGCPRNAWNTAPGGGRGKACGDHRRLAIVPLADLQNEAFGGPILLRVPAASLSDAAAYDAKYDRMGYPYYSIGTKLSFDAKEAYPKLVFEAMRPLSDAEAVQVIEWRKSAEVARVISEGPPPLATPQVLPAAVMAPPSPVFKQAVDGAGGPGVPGGNPPAHVTPAPVVATGFGPAASAPAAAPAAGPAPRQMTGFGPAVTAPVTPAGNPPPVQQVAPAPAAPAPAAPAPAAPAKPEVTVTKFDASLDERLANLIND